MNPDRIRQAVELADGFGLTDDGKGFGLMIHKLDGTDWTWCFGDFDEPPDFLKDALAAQLTRQVDEITDTRVCLDVEVECGMTTIWKHDEAGYPEELRIVTGKDRTANTLNVILDSGVLK